MYRNKYVASLFKPAKELGFESDNTIAEAWWNYGSGTNWNGNPKLVGQTKLSITSEYWSWPIYDASEATTQIRIWRNLAVWDETARWSTIKEFQEPWGGPASKNGVLIPFNPSWKTGKGTDQGIIIKDGKNYYTILNLRKISPLENLGIIAKTFTWWPWGSAQVSLSDYVCDGIGLNTPENAGQIEGCGSGKIPKHVGILTADMLLNGVDQALSMVVANSMMGPGAVYRLPATRAEFSSDKDVIHRYANHPSTRNMPIGNDPRMVPCGSRIIVNKTDEEIWAWAMTKPEGMRTAAFNLGCGLATYGFVTKESGDGETQIESEGLLNDKAKNKFALAGLKEGSDFRTILDGLITSPDDLRVVKEPK